MNGTGTYKYETSSKGKTLKGSFKENKPSGECSYITKKGTKYKTTWASGKCSSVVQEG